MLSILKFDLSLTLFELFSSLTFFLIYWNINRDFPCMSSILRKIHFFPSIISLPVSVAKDDE